MLGKPEEPLAIQLVRKIKKMATNRSSLIPYFKILKPKLLFTHVLHAPCSMPLNRIHEGSLYVREEHQTYRKHR